MSVVVDFNLVSYCSELGCLDPTILLDSILFCDQCFNIVQTPQRLNVVVNSFVGKESFLAAENGVQATAAFREDR